MSSRWNSQNGLVDHEKRRELSQISVFPGACNPAANQQMLISVNERRQSVQTCLNVKSVGMQQVNNSSPTFIYIKQWITFFIAY